MSNVVDITRRLQERRHFDYESGEAAIIAARSLTDRLVDSTELQLVVPTDDIYAIALELRAIVHAEATWPEQHDAGHPEAK